MEVQAPPAAPSAGPSRPASGEFGRFPRSRGNTHTAAPHRCSLPVLAHPLPLSHHPARALDAAAVAALYQNCLKLASENKITAKNTWALPLIDHMADLVAAGGPAGGGADGADGTDFQRASLTLAAGVSIYAHRVDAVHGDVFRILGGLGRPADGKGVGDDKDEVEGAGAADDEGEEEDAGAGGDANARRGRRGRGAAASDPAATLAPREDITAPQFDLAFAVDPLFQRTAAQFDEGGAGGLLLAGLPLDRGCCLAFDSGAVPDEGGGDGGGDGGDAAVPSLGPPLSGWAESGLAALAAAARAGLAVAAPDGALAELLRLGGGLAAAGAPPGEADALVARVVAGLVGGVALGGPVGGESAGAPRPAPAAEEGDWGAASLGGDAPDDDDDDDDEDANADFVDAAEHFSGRAAEEGGERDGPGVPDWMAGGGGSLPATPSFRGGAGAGADSAGTEDALRWLVAGGAALPGGGGEEGDDALAAAAPPPTHTKAWAGAAHWRHRAARGAGVGTGFGTPPPAAAPLGGSGRPLPPPKAARCAPLDFGALPPLPPAALRRAPARETTLRGGLKPGAVPPADTLLPDDLHCEPACLGRLFLAPECPPAAAAAAAAAGGGGRGGEARHDRSAAGSPAGRGGGGWGDGGGGFGGGASEDDDDAAPLPDGFAGSPAASHQAPGEGLPCDAAGVLAGAAGWGAGGGGGGGGGPPPLHPPGTVAPAARLTSGPPIAYTRTAKQVDVRLLKEALWEAAQARAAEAEAAVPSGRGGTADPAGPPVPLAALVRDVGRSATGRAAAPPGQLSPHLVFICLLHLCNEHGLALGRGGGGEVDGAAPPPQPAARLGGGADLVVRGVRGGA